MFSAFHGAEETRSGLPAGGMCVTRGTLRGYGVTVFNVGKLISRIICQHVQMKKLCNAAVV